METMTLPRTHGGSRGSLSGPGPAAALRQLLCAGGVALVLAGCGDPGSGGGAAPAGGEGRAGESGPGGGSGAAFCREVRAAVDDFSPPPAQPSGGVVVGGVVEIPGGLNALVSGDYGGGQHQAFVSHMTLVRLDEDLQPEPYLAKSWEVSPGEDAVVFRLRDDVYWHDGTPTTARDVAFTYRMASDPEGAFPNGAFFERYVRGEEGVEVLDSFTVRIRMQPHRDFLDAWRALAIMPEHLLGGVGWEEMAQHPYNSRCPVGNGPFVFQEHRVGDRWVFRANPHHPADLGGPPASPLYTYRTIPEETTRMAELAAGGIHLDISVSADRLDDLARDPGLEPVVFETRGYTFLGWNTRRPGLDDPRVRRALTLALDREAILGAVAGGEGTILNGTVPPFHRGFDPALAEALPHDPGAARALLDEAGWRDRDGDGVRENAAGSPLAIGILVSENREWQELAQLAQIYFREVGVDASVETMEWAALAGRITAPERDFDAFVLSWVPDFRLDDRDQFHSGRAQGPFAFAGISDGELDALMDSLAEMPASEDDRALWRAYQERLLDLQPYTVFYNPAGLSARVRELEGVRMDPRGEWATVTRWRLEEVR